MHYALFEIMLPALGRKHISEFHAKTRFRTDRAKCILGSLAPSLALLGLLQNHYKTNGFEHMALLAPSLDQPFATDAPQLSPLHPRMALQMAHVPPRWPKICPM